MWYIPTLFHAVSFSLSMFRKVVQRSSFVLLLWFYYLSFLQLLLTLYFVPTSDTTCLVLFWPVIWLDVTSSCPACPLPAMLCHFSAFISATSLAWKRALYPNPQDFHAVIFPCKTCEHVSAAVLLLYVTFSWTILFLLVVCFLHPFLSVYFILQLLNILCGN